MKRLKAFTLIELIVVMVIFGIIMVGIMNLIEPINSSAQTQKVANNQRRVQTNISTYIGENVRYAENLVIVEGGTVENAVKHFIAAKPKDMNGKYLDFSTSDARKKIQVICFDGVNAYKYGDVPATTRSYAGRLLRTNNNGTSYSLTSLSDVGQYQNNCSDKGDKSLYTVFGDNYYSHADYYLSVKYVDEAGTVVDPISSQTPPPNIDGALSLQITVDSDYYMNAGSKNVSNKMLTSNSTTQTFLLLNSRVSTFVFDMAEGNISFGLDDLGEHPEKWDPSTKTKKEVASDTRSDGKCIYFVYSGGENISQYQFSANVVLDPDSPRDSGHVKWNNVADGVRLNYEAQRAGVVGTPIDAKTSELAYNRGGVDHTFTITIKHNDDGTYTVSGALSFTGNSEDAQTAVNDFLKDEVGDLGMNYVTLS